MKSVTLAEGMPDDPEFQQALGKSPIASLLRFGFVYVATRPDYAPLVKIGFSTDVERRMEELGARLQYFRPASLAFETALHRVFAQKRERGEWFRLSYQDMNRLWWLMFPWLDEIVDQLMDSWRPKR